MGPLGYIVVFTAVIAVLILVVIPRLRFGKFKKAH